MTERTTRISAMTLTFVIAALMTCLTGCGGCSSETAATGDESAEQSSESAKDDSGAAAVNSEATDVSQASSDGSPAEKGKTKTSKRRGKTERKPASESAKGESPKALDAEAKRLANRKTMEADLKKRANRRRAADKEEPAAKESPRAPGTAPAAPAPPDSPLARAVPDVQGKGAGRKTSASQPAGPKPKLLNVARFMTITDARKITGDATLSKGKPLTGIEPSAHYNVSYFAPQLRSKFGVSVQVWKEKIRRDANDRFRKMKRDYPNAETTTAIQPSALFSHFQGIMTLSFADLTKSMVVSVSCGDTVCSDDELVALANAVKKKL
jgi:hypothetical protein